MNLLTIGAVEVIRLKGDICLAGIDLDSTDLQGSPADSSLFCFFFTISLAYVV